MMMTGPCTDEFRLCVRATAHASMHARGTGSQHRHALASRCLEWMSEAVPRCESHSVVTPSRACVQVRTVLFSLCIFQMVHGVRVMLEDLGGDWYYYRHVCVVRNDGCPVLGRHLARAPTTFKRNVSEKSLHDEFVRPL